MKTLAKEHGFWAYTAPGTGGMEGFQRQDYEALLEDMLAARMNSICVVVKWLTTGYRSRLKFLDQSPANLVIQSDNQLLRDFMAAARKQGVKTWLAAVVNMFPVEKFRLKARRFCTIRSAQDAPIRIGIHDLDCAEVGDCATQIFGELYELFPGIAGFAVEVEDSGFEAPHRIAPYNRWARRHDRPPFHRIAHPLQSRAPDLAPWRDYITERRCAFAKRIETNLRRKGFRGEMAMLCETGRQPCMLTQEINLESFKKNCPRWSAVTYEGGAYDKTRNRFGMMELCMEDPKRAGLKTYYLPRGVMTWTLPKAWPMALSLKQSWRLELEDIARFKPDGVWWFGCGTGCVPEGAHVNVHLSRLRELGFKDGRAARRALLKQIQMFTE